MENDLGRIRLYLQPFEHLLQAAREASLLQATASDEAAAAPASTGAPKTKKAQKGSTDASIQAIGKSMAAIGQMPSKAEMPLMLGLMKSMYEDWKQKVGDANRAEKDQKADLAKTLKDLDEKMKEHKLDKHSYDIISRYRIKARAIAHRQFHNVLKICHSGMAQFKNVIQAMEEAKAGKKIDLKTARALGVGAGGELPEVVLLQQVARLGDWSRGAKSELRTIAANGPEESAEAAKMLEKLEGVASKMRSLSRTGAGSTFDTIAGIAAAAEQAVSKAKNASTASTQQTKILQRSLGEEGLGSWMGKIAEQAARNVEEKETQEAELLLALLSQHQGIWSVEKMVETAEDFAAHGNYAALELVRWAAAHKGFEAQNLSIQLAKVMDARKAKKPTVEQRDFEAGELQAFKLGRHLAKMQGTVEKVAKLVPEQMRAKLGVEAMRQRLKKSMAGKDPVEMATTEKAVLAWAAKVSASATAKEADPNKGLLVLAQLLE